MTAPETPHMKVVQVSDYWQARCECGWSSKAIRFPDPDAAYHCGTLHDAAAHPERIDWEAEAAGLRRESRIAEVAAETATAPDSLWWLSFADASRPTGSQFLGACLVEAPNLPSAVTASHRLGINPGGEVAVAGPIPPDQRPPGYPLNRLLSRDEIEKLDRAGRR